MRREHADLSAADRTGGARSERPRVAANMMQQAADYLEKVSLSNPDREEYNFKTLPRPKGKATKVIITSSTCRAKRRSRMTS